MRLILFLNNWGGWQVAKWLHARREEVVGVVVQPESDQRFAAEILKELDLPPDRVWRAPQLRTPETVSRIRDLRPDLGISAWFGYLLKPDLLGVFGTGCINLHAAYLPWNRGWHTNVWPILDGSPAGITIHFIDPGVDTGDLIAQRKIPVTPIDTGGSLHQKLTMGMVDLFMETWPSVRGGTCTRTPQDHSNATKHKRADLAALDQIDLEKEYAGRDLLNLLRARTYPPYPAAYFVEQDRRTYVRVQFYREETLSPAISARGSEPLDLEARYPARQFLDLLNWIHEPGQPAVHIAHGGQRYFVASNRLKEEAIDTSGSPAWLSVTP